MHVIKQEMAAAVAPPRRKRTETRTRGQTAFFPVCGCSLNRDALRACFEMLPERGVNARRPQELARTMPSCRTGPLTGHIFNHTLRTVLVMNPRSRLRLTARRGRATAATFQFLRNESIGQASHRRACQENHDQR
jgi:hypothetical protein